jgi:crotonobetainyl-CoA:carnitine CoA-transferase CaiB-like acyl-CoA transferase
MMLALGVVSAIRAAEKVGEGADVDVALFDAAVHQLAYQGTWYLNDRTVTGRTPRSAHPSTTPVQLFKTQDGWIYVACMNEKFWHLLVELLKQPALAADPAFSTLEGRLEHRDALTALLDGLFAGRSTEEWMALLAGKLPIAPVYDLEQALESDFLREESDMIRPVAHPLRPQMLAFANPIRLRGKRLPQRHAPALGAHTAEICRQLDLFGDDR